MQLRQTQNVHPPADCCAVLQVWFPRTWASISGPFPNQTALDFFVFSLIRAPRAALEMRSLYPAFNTTGAIVSCCFRFRGTAYVHCTCTLLD